MNRKIIHGDSQQKLKEFAADTVDLIVTDPPYGYSFMNKEWDKALVPIEIWQECLRVLKPGAFAFIMSAPRQDVMSRMILNLDAAGFIIHYTPVFWAYASGFPKAANMAKLVDKKLGIEPQVVGKSNNKIHLENIGPAGYKNEFEITEPSSPQAKKLNGSYAGFQPKPAVEVILIAMKPLKEKNYIDQAMQNGKGITWLDDCRIPYIDENDIGDPDRCKGYPVLDSEKGWNQNDLINNVTIGEKGRFPANLIVSDDALNHGKTSKSQKSLKKPDSGGPGHSLTFAHDKEEERGYNDSGSFSRYFDLDKWAAQFLITPKPSTSEKEKGLNKFIEKNVNDGRKNDTDVPFQRGQTKRKNTHPTVKPVNLMKYLITMGSRENELVLDPFFGSGTTAIACEQLARSWIGIELVEEHIAIAEGRLNELRKQQKLEAFS